MELCLIKQLNGTFKVAFPSDQERAQKLKVGDLLKCKVTRPRNYEFHKKFFALLNLAYSNQEIYDDFDQFREQLIMASGYYNRYKNHKGVDCFEAKSISFANMPEDEFDKLYSDVLNKIIEIFGWGEDSVFEQELINFF